MVQTQLCKKNNLANLFLQRMSLIAETSRDLAAAVQLFTVIYTSLPVCLPQSASPVGVRMKEFQCVPSVSFDHLRQ